jgi:hypothetical protein
VSFRYGSCTSILRIIPQPEKRVVYYRFPFVRGNDMVDNLLFHELLLLGLLWLCVIWCWRWSKRQVAPGQAHGQPITRSQRHATDQKAFPGLTTKPFCGFCQISRQQGQNRVFLHLQPTVFTRHARGRRFHIPPQKASLARNLTEPRWNARPAGCPWYC